MKDEDTLDTTEQRLIHGLLSDLHDSSKEARLKLVMQAEEPPRSRPWGRVAAALAFMAVGAASGILLQSRLPEAQAVIDRASKEARDVRDRQYQVTIVALKAAASDEVASGTLHVRGAEAFAIQFRASFAKGWYGSDGQKTWFLPSQGKALEWSAPQDASWKERDKLDFVKFESFLGNFKGRFDVTTLGRENGLLKVRATRKLDLAAETISQFDIWVSEQTGIMMKLQYRMDPELWHWDPWLVTIEHKGDEPHAAGYYTLDSIRRAQEPQ